MADVDVERWPLDPYQVMDYLQRFPNKTQSVIVFCTNTSWRINDTQVPCYAEDYHLNTYSIVFNLSLFHRVPFFSDLRMAYPKDMVTVRLKKDIDEGLIKYYLPEAEVNITAT